MIYRYLCVICLILTGCESQTPSIPPISETINAIYVSEHPVINRTDAPEDILIVETFDEFQQMLQQKEFTYFYFDNESITWVDSRVLQRLYENQKVIIAIDVPLSILTQRFNIKSELTDVRPRNNGDGFIVSYINKLQYGLSATTDQFTDVIFDFASFHEALTFSHTKARCSVGEIPKSGCQ